MQKRKRAPGRPPLGTPKQLLLAMARQMLEHRVPQWRAACTVAASRAGESFSNAQSLASASLVRRLHEAFKKQAQSLLAEAGRQIEFERRHAKARAEMEAGLARGEVPAWMSAGTSAFSRLPPEVRAAMEAEQRSMRVGLAAFSAMTTQERAVEEAMRRAYGPTSIAQWLREDAARAKVMGDWHHSTLISSVRPR